LLDVKKMAKDPIPHVLISNDDGFDAPGLAALHEALSGIAEISVVAPAHGVSSAGHGVTDRQPIDVERREVGPFGAIHIVHALPADCVRLGVTELLKHRPDWVMSGINRGGNLGVDVFYSGTVAAAREAAFLGIPAVAISQYIRTPGAEPDWPRASEWTRAAIERILAASDRNRPPVWNVNLPSLEPSEQPGEMTVAPLALTPLQMRFERAAGQTDSQTATYQFAGRYSQRPAPPGTDVHATFTGHVTLTPLSLDLTVFGKDGRPVRLD
jgi:5'-nucleotidase